VGVGHESRTANPESRPFPVRVVGIDPGTVSIDACGLVDGRPFLDLSVPTGVALADAAAFVARLRIEGPVDLIAGPSGYGLPLVRGEELTDEAVRLALLTAPGEGGGLGGLGALMRALAASALPVVFTPGVVHLPTVAAHRKVNRVDLGTADKVCSAALAIDEQAARRSCALTDVSLILLELGGAFTAALAVDGGRIVDGIGGSAGPLGLRGPGAGDGEVAFLADHVPKSLLFRGGAAAVRGDEVVDGDALARPETPRQALAWSAYLDGACKAVAALAVTVPRPAEIVLSGRLAGSDAVFGAVTERLRALAPVHRLRGFARVAKHAAQGAALIADGLAGGSHAGLVDTLALRQAAGTVLDHLYVISPEQARQRLGL
jgi:predicted butyrate kinase (DUF1464 family)